MSDTGGGHRSVAHALEQGLARVAGADVHVRTADLFTYGRPTLAGRSTRLYSPMIRYAPWLYGLLYHVSNRPGVYAAVAERAGSGVRRWARQLLVETEPDVVVSVHPLCNLVTLQALEDLGWSTPMAAVVTELVSVHTSWVDRRIALYTTATDEATAAVLAHGAPADRVRCLGLPVDPRFGNVPLHPADVRRELGLDVDRLTVLMMGGGEGAGRLGTLVQAVSKARLNLQLIVVCGRNERLRQRLLRRSYPFPVRVLGFVRTVPELMHAADLVVTKGGPQTIAEALAAGRPVLLTQVLPGQEEGNGEFVTRHGVGHVATSPGRLVALLRQLAAAPGELRRLGENACRIARRDAAMSVARAVLELAS